MRGSDRVWFLVNLADYAVSMLVDTMLYEDYAAAVTGAYVKGDIRSLNDFDAVVSDFIASSDDYQIDELAQIVDGVKQVLNYIS